MPRMYTLSGWLGALVLLVYGPFARAADFPEFPMAEHMEVVVVAEQLTYNNVPMRLFRFRSGEPPDAVAAYYREQWQGEVAGERLPAWRILSHRDGDYLLTVQIEEPPEGEDAIGTRGTLSVAPMFSDDLEPGAGLGRGVQLMPGAEVMTDIRSEDGGRSSRTLVVRHEDSVPRHRDYYRSLYQRQGWQSPVDAVSDTIIPGGIGTEQNAFLLEKGGRELSAAFARVDGYTYSTLVFTR